MIINDKRLLAGDSLEERLAAIENAPREVPFIDRDVKPLNLDFIDGDLVKDRHFDENPRGPLTDIRKYISEEALIRWDIDVANLSVGWAGFEVTEHLRFVKKCGYWRAWDGRRDPCDFGKRDNRGFVAQWEPDVAADETGIPGRWVRVNSLVDAVECTFSGSNQYGFFAFRMVLKDNVHDYHIPDGNHHGNYHRVGLTRSFKRGRDQHSR